MGRKQHKAQVQYTLLFKSTLGPQWTKITQTKLLSVALTTVSVGKRIHVVIYNNQICRTDYIIPINKDLNYRYLN